MSWTITQNGEGTWGWAFFQSAYGAASGTERTLAEAKVELAIAQADVMEHPFPPAVVDVMRADPERYAADYPDPAP